MSDLTISYKGTQTIIQDNDPNVDFSIQLNGKIILDSGDFNF